MAIADDIAVKESVQVQQQPTQSVNSVSKNSAVSPPSGGNSHVPPSLRQGIRPNSSSPPQSNSYTCFSCGNATCRNCNTRGHIARACKKNGVNAVCVEDELTEEPLLEEDKLYMVYDVNAISRSEISVPLKIQNWTLQHYDELFQLELGCYTG